VRISNEGEALFRGPTIFAGYYKEPQKTASALDPQGWFHSGDAVSLLDDGHLVVLGRINEMGELANRMKYAPEYIESQLRFGTYIKDAVTVGSKNHDYVSVLINVDFESVGKWAESHHLSYTTYVDLSQKSEVADLVLQEIKRVNETLPEGTKIKKYVVLHKELDPDEAELTRTRKLRRQFLLDRYRELVDTIYTNQVEYALKTEVTYRDGRKGTVTASLKIRAVPNTKKGDSKSSVNLFSDHTKGAD
jgi:long-chain acyl-CoA synthetase